MNVPYVTPRFVTRYDKPASQDRFPVMHKHFLVNLFKQFCFQYSAHTYAPVSYTHLDVYKRQVYASVDTHLLIFGQPLSGCSPLTDKAVSRQYHIADWI